MPLQLPNLDDRTYDDLVQEAISLIPAYAPEWTNYNSSDPGITLIELFAYLSEILIYRLNRVTNANRQAFLNLMVGLNEKGQQQYPTPLDEETLEQEIRKTVLQLRQSDRAITCEDFERHAIAVNQTLPATAQKVARAHCIPRRNLATGDLQSGELPGHISVVIVPALLLNTSASDVLQQTTLQPTPELIQAVSNDLEQRRLLTTRVHVVSPRYVQIGVQLEIHLKRDALESTVRPLVENTLKRFLHPLLGGTEGKGWIFGRSVFVSEIYQLLDQLSGVEFVAPAANQPELNLRDRQNLSSAVSGDRLLKNDRGDLIGIQLFLNELVNLSQMQLTFISPVV
jgi:hypothetical protein